MRKRRLPSRFHLLLPACTGLLFAVALSIIFPTLPIIILRADISTLLIILGSLVTFILWLKQRRIRDQQASLQQLADQKAEENQQFLLRLDHELKNPISIIHTGLACLNQLSPEIQNDLSHSNAMEVQKIYGSIQNQVRHISQLVNDLRKLAELETCQLDISSVDIHCFLEQLFQDLQLHHTDSTGRLSLSLPRAPWRLPKIQTDEDLLYLCIRNLIDNAIKYTAPQEPIEIRAYENQSHILIEIADRGMGIPADELEQVWGKLYRAKNSRALAGHGMGLAIVQTILQRLETQCDLRSREDMGTIICLQLPKTDLTPT